MEMNELRYFLATAETENLHRAAKRLAVSPGSLSKAVARLEAELGAPLFSREGRHIRLTARGKLLQRRGSEILELEQATRAELGGGDQKLQVVLTGEEQLLAKYAPPLLKRVSARFTSATFEVRACSSEEVLRRIESGEAHLGLTTAVAPRGLHAKRLDKIRFQTVVGRGHPLYTRAKSEVISIAEVLRHPFVVPEQEIWGKTGRFIDGWRDDKYPRLVAYRSSSLKILETLVTSGLAVAYLPSYFAELLDVRVLKISGCPYTCEQTVQLISRRPREMSWMIQSGIIDPTGA